MDKYTSRSRYWIDTALKQPGITENTTIGELKKMLADDGAARLLDQQADSPMYANTSFMRFTYDGLLLLASCSQKAIKLFIHLTAHANQSLRITVSKNDLSSLTGLSKPTLRDAVEELESKGVIIVEEGDHGKGEADTYYLNPGICSCSKMSKQLTQEAMFWSKTITDTDEVQIDERKAFLNLLQYLQDNFKTQFKTIEDKDKETREPLGVTIELAGKTRTQEQIGRRRKKKVSVCGTDQQDIQSPTSHVYDNQQIEKKQVPVENNMLNQPQKTPVFAIDSEIPFNDMPGQMTFSDFPEMMPEGVENEKPAGNDK